MKIFYVLFLSFLLTALSGISAQAASKKPEPPMPAPIKSLVEEGAQVRYLGNEGGLDGWLALKGGQPQYFYVTPDQQSIVMGILFNNKGDVVTLRQLNELRGKEGPALDQLAGFKLDEEEDAIGGTSSKPDFADPSKLAKAATTGKAEKLYQQVSDANWVTIGKPDAPAIYSFIDPDCPHCHDLIQDVRKSGALERGEVQLRLIPVGLISENSLKEAAFLLASPNAQELLFRHLDGDEKALAAPEGINTQGVQRNMSLMQDWKFDVTPFSIYKDASGEVKILRGRPDNLKELVKGLR